jgi:hypothetical protein
LEKHPDKTLIGWIERGLDFLGYHFGPEGLLMVARTIEQFVERALRLYDQETGAPRSTERRYRLAFTKNPKNSMLCELSGCWPQDDMGSMWLAAGRHTGQRLISV